MKKEKWKNAPNKAGVVDKHIGVQIREGRLAVGLSQAELAVQLDISRAQVHKYEHGRNRVSAAHLFHICEVLEVSLASMFERKLPTYSSGPRPPKRLVSLCKIDVLIWNAPRTAGDDTSVSSAQPTNPQQPAVQNSPARAGKDCVGTN